MGVLDFLKGPNINEGLEKYRQYKYAVLVDLRSEKDFSKGRIPGSIKDRRAVPDLDRPEAFDAEAACVGSLQHVDTADQRGFTGSGITDDAEDLPLADVQRDPVDGAEIAVLSVKDLGELSELDHVPSSKTKPPLQT